MDRAQRALAVIGAAGDIGSGVVRSAVTRGWAVTGVGRRASALDALTREHGSGLRAVVGDLSSDDGAEELARAVGPVDAIVVAISPAFTPRPIADWSVTELNDFVAGNLGAHLAAARHLLPLVRDGGDYLGIGGGMADMVIPRYVAMAVVQAAQRQLYRGLVREGSATTSARVRELIVAALVDGPSSRAAARPDWITDDEVGDHVIDLLDEAVALTSSSQTIVTLRSPREVRREQPTVRSSSTSRPGF